MPIPAKVHNFVTDKLASTDFLRYIIGSAVIVEGLDKFFNILINWHIYLPFPIVNYWPFSDESFLWLLGVTEIIIGIIYLFSVRIGSWLVAGLMAGIICNLLLLGDFYNMILLNLIVGIAALTTYAVKERQ